MIEKFAKFSLNKIELNQVRGGEIPPVDELPMPIPQKPTKGLHFSHRIRIDDEQ